MQLITQQDLIAMGIQLDDKQLKALVDHANETLNERVGADIVESLDDESLKEYLDIQQTGNDEEASAWLTANVPELEQIVENERDIVLGELADHTENFA